MREKLVKIGAFVAVAGMALTGFASRLSVVTPKYKGYTQ